MQRFTDERIGDVRAVVVTGVDVVDAARNRFAQYGQGGIAIFRRSEHAGAGQLHRTKAQSFHRAIAERK